MKTTAHTSISNLAATGRELAEEHLTLATGAARPYTYIYTEERPGGDRLRDYYA